MLCRAHRNAPIKCIAIPRRFCRAKHQAINMPKRVRSFPTRHSHGNCLPRFQLHLPKFPDATDLFFRLSLVQQRELRCLPLSAVHFLDKRMAANGMAFDDAGGIRPTRTDLRHPPVIFVGSSPVRTKPKRRWRIQICAWSMQWKLSSIFFFGPA